MIISVPGPRTRAAAMALRGGDRGYPAVMEGLDHLEHLDKHLVDELAQVARETVRDELREQTRKQRRTATLYAASEPSPCTRARPSHSRWDWPWPSGCPTGPPR